MFRISKHLNLILILSCSTCTCVGSTGIQYQNYYTFNDNSISDVFETMIEAYKIYGNEQYLDAAKQCGDFIILAQMPEPQQAWAQQYNENMEPAWARKFEPPAITGGETF